MFGLSSLATAIAGAVLALAAGFGAGWQTRAWKAGADDRDRAEFAASDLRQQAAAQRSASATLQADLHNIAGRGLKLQGEMHADLSRPVLDCPKVAGDAVFPGGLARLLNDIDNDDQAPAAR